MDIRLKQRLVGAIVLVALAVIFIPMVLQPPEEMRTPDTRIPSQPDVAFTDRLAEPAPEAPATPAEPARQVVPAPAEPPAEAPKPAPEPATTPVPTEAPAAELSSAEDVVTPKEPAPAPVLGAWVVQVGVFGQEPNAQSLARRLRDKGYTTFVERFAGKGGANYRVRVGPVEKRAEADRLLAKLKVEGVAGMVKSYP